MSSHTGVWPSYQQVRQRTIAGLDEYGTVYTARGDILARGVGYADLRNTALENKLDVYVDSVTSESRIDLLFDALEDPTASVLCARSGGVVGVRFVGSNRRTATLSQLSNWGIDHPSVDALRVVEAVSSLLEAGTYISPGAAGEAHWRAARRDYAPVSVPCMAAQRDILAHIVGGRVDTPALGEQFAQAYESDLRSAYPALSIGVPVGTAGSFSREPQDDETATYFAVCTVCVPGHWRGPSPISLNADMALVGYRGGSLRRSFRAVPGTYAACWLWREEIEACRSAGYTVTVGGGWYWTRMETHNREWLHRLALARRDAPSSEVVGLVKRVGVAAIGRHGMGDTTYELRDEEHADQSADIPLVVEWAGEPILGLWLHAVQGPPSHHLPHWYSYIVMKCRLALWRRYMAEERAGNRVLMSNFDALYTAGPPTEPVSEVDEPGTWKQSVLHEMEIVAPRSYRAREKTVLPGVKRG